MSGKVGLNEILAYAKANNLTFEQAAQQNGLSPWEIENLKTELAGTPEAPVDALVINTPKEEKTSAQSFGKVYNQDTIKDDEYSKVVEEYYIDYLESNKRKGTR